MHVLASRALFESELKNIAGKLASARGWLIHRLEYPFVEVTFTAEGRTALRLLADCTNWNSEPPSFKLCAATSVPLQPSNPPPAEIWPNSSGVFNPSQHPATGLPFICSPGSHEYHVHPSHTNDHWDRYSVLGGYDLGGLLTRYWHAWLRGTG